MEYVLKQIVTITFERDVGRFQRKMLKGELGHAMLVSFQLRVDYEREEGWKILDLLIYAPANYVGVLTRVRSSLAPANAEEGVTGEYVDTVSPWKVESYHDSCWRDAVDSVLFEQRQEIVTLEESFGSSWYRKVPCPEGAFDAIQSRKDS